MVYERDQENNTAQKALSSQLIHKEVGSPKIVADTDIIVDYLRAQMPQAKVFKKLLLQDRLLFTAISAYELRVGSRVTRRQADLAVLFQEEITLPLDLRAAIAAGKVITQLRGKGEEIGPGDVLIAGICLSHQLPLLTRNVDHFGRVEGLISYTPEQLQE